MRLRASTDGRVTVVARWSMEWEGWKERVTIGQSPRYFNGVVERKTEKFGVGRASQMVVRNGRNLYSPIWNHVDGLANSWLDSV